MSLNPKKPLNNKQQRFRLIGLRGKLLLVTLLLFILPLSGFNYLNKLDQFLKDNHARSVLDSAQIIASVFRDNAAINALNRLTQSQQQPVYCPQLSTGIMIDGFADDWQNYTNTQPVLLKLSTKTAQKQLSITCSHDEQYYYFLASVKQKSLKPIINPQQSAIIHFSYLNYYHQIAHYQFNLLSPGWIHGELSDNNIIIADKTIRGEWQPLDNGFNLEFKVPIQSINHYINLSTQAQQSSQVSINMDNINELKPLLQIDTLTNLRLKQLIPDHTRLWLINKKQYVTAKARQQSNNELQQTTFSLLSLYRHFYQIFANQSTPSTFYNNHQNRIITAAAQRAVNGLASVQWLDNPYSDQMILSVTVPVYNNDNKVIGALILEQKNNSLLALQDNTFEQILWLSLILFFTISITLLFFSSRLLKRIINLRDDTNNALSHDGKIHNQLYRNDNDEIGDLARSFSALLSRIEQNNDYLHSLSSKLSHELRTPITIIKSSLENMEITNHEKNQQQYIQRAHEGCIRLNNLLNRMSEASQLERSIQSIDKEHIEIITYLKQYIAAIQTAHPSIDFVFNSTIQQLIMLIAPELIAQLLDKLIANAISFQQINTPITLSLQQRNKLLHIELNNYGERIEKDKLKAIFSSLTSYRNKKTAHGHLGIGLYIAQLISHFHQGSLIAVNNEQNQSVSFILTIPINRSN